MIRVGVVLGNKQSRFLEWYFDAISSDLELYFFELQSRGLNSGSPHQVTYFEPVKELLGYMRGLEKSTDGMDIIVGFLSEPVSAFQALGIAEKSHMKFALIVDTPALSYNSPDLFSISQQLLSRSNLFLCSDSSHKDLILLEGASEDKVFELPQLVTTQHRPNFYNLCSYFDETITHIVCGSSLENYHDLCEFINIVRQNIDLESEKGFLISLIGDGENDQIKRLSYYIYDMGLSKYIRILQLNSFELKAATVDQTDIYIDLSSRCDIFSESYALLVQAHSSGKVIYSSPNSKTSEILQLHCLKNFSLDLSQSSEPKGIIDYSNHLIDIFSKLTCQSSSTDILTFYKKLFEAGDYEIVLSNHEQILKNINGATKASLLHLVGASYYRLGSYSSAETILKESLAIHVSIDASNLLAKILFASTCFDDALAHYKASIAIEEENEEAMFGIACVYERTGLYEESLVWLQKCIFRSIAVDKYMTLFARICLEVEDENFAIEKLDNLISICGEVDCLLFSLGKLYISRGDSKRGFEYIERSRIVELDKAS